MKNKEIIKEIICYVIIIIFILIIAIVTNLSDKTKDEQNENIDSKIYFNNFIIDTTNDNIVYDNPNFNYKEEILD